MLTHSISRPESTNEALNRHARQAERHDISPARASMLVFISPLALTSWWESYIQKVNKTVVCRQSQP